MSLKDYKITDDAVQNVYVQSQPDILNGTTQENKAAFDKYPALIKDRFNAVLENLGGDSAASEILIQAIEGLTAGNVQQALAELKSLLDAYIAKIMSTAGAAEVGISSISGVSGNTVQQALQSIKGIIDSIEAGTLPDGAVTSELIANGAVTKEKLESGLASQIAVLGGATTPQEALAALGAGVRPTLLDNADFRSGHVVNQQNISSVSTSNTYLVDRWKLYASGTVSLVPNGVQMQGVIDFGTQIEIARVEVGKPYTFSVLTSDGKCGWATHSFQGNENESFYQELEDTGITLNVIYNWSNTSTLLIAFQGSETLSLAKVEQGENQTLAYQDSDGVWHLLPQPESDYATQLAKCQRYYWDSGVESYGGCSGIASGKRMLSCNVQFPITMRAVPSIKIYNGNSENEIRNSNTNAKVPLGTTGKYANQSGLSFLYNGSEDVFEDGAVYDFRVIANAEL